jgi:hypothetical protein
MHLFEASFHCSVFAFAIYSQKTALERDILIDT